MVIPLNEEKPLGYYSLFSNVIYRALFELELEQARKLSGIVLALLQFAL